jgi:hypothetical protein
VEGDLAEPIAQRALMAIAQMAQALNKSTRR